MRTSPLPWRANRRRYSTAPRPLRSTNRSCAASTTNRDAPDAMSAEIWSRRPLTLRASSVPFRRMTVTPSTVSMETSRGMKGCYTIQHVRMTHISRRDFVALTAAGAAATPFLLNDALSGAAAAVTAQEIIDRVKKNIGVEWTGGDVDTFKAGDPSTAVTGVVTTSMATLSVLQQAVLLGANLVITAAPTFYSRADRTRRPRGGDSRRLRRRRPVRCTPARTRSSSSTSWWCAG